MTGERTLPGLGLYGFWTPGSDGWDAQMDGNLRQLSALTQLSVLDRVASVPGSPSDGDIYLMTSGGNANDIALRDNGAWVYLTPQEGWKCYVRDEDTIYIWTGSAWALLSTVLALATLTDIQSADIGTFCAGLPEAGETLLGYTFNRALDLPTSLTGSNFYAKTPATANQSFSLTKNGSSIGSVNFALSSNTATITFASPVSFAAADRFEVIGPNPQDATLADIFFNFRFLRP